MKLIYRSICLLGLTIAFFSCKNETKSASQNEETTETAVAVTEAGKIPEKKDLSMEEKNQVNSVLMKAMVTPELKSFVSLMVTSGVTDMLAKNQGPFTVFAPSNDALKAMSAAAMNTYLNPENKANLENLVNSHIVKANLESITLVQNIKDANGSYEMTTLSGETLTASREGTTIVLSNATGKKAMLEKSDIIGGNGVVHVLDNVLFTK